jgi:hypothetical protein
MAIVLKPKKSETASAVPTTSDLAVGEICVNVADRKIYTRKSNNSIVVVGSHIETDVGGTSVGGDLTGTVSNITIPTGAITSAMLGVDVIVAEDIAANAITVSELQDNAVVTSKIAANAVDGTKIALGSDAAGDVMYYNGANYIRLAKGTAGQVLTVNSGATAPEWAADSTNVSGTSVGGDLSGTVSNAQIATNTVGITELNVSDGTTGQILKTNGSGTLSFTDSGATIQQATSKAVTMAIALG